MCIRGIYSNVRKLASYVFYSERPETVTVTVFKVSFKISHGML
jgi:hypothetical protein